MGSQYVVIPSGQTHRADVGTPQAANLVRLPCHSETLSDMILAGRTRAALMSYRGQARACVAGAPKKRWSRGCRRADVSFWFWLWLRPWLLAPRRKSLWLSRSRSSRPKPASTSDRSGQVAQPRLIAPAPNHRLLRCGAVDRPAFSPNSVDFPRSGLWAAARAWRIAPFMRHYEGQQTC